MSAIEAVSGNLPAFFSGGGCAIRDTGISMCGPERE